MATLEKSGGSGSSNNNNNNTDKKESTHNAQCSCCCYSSAQPINRANVFEDNVVLCVCVCDEDEPGVDWQNISIVVE
jgi:hypothetical protein